MLMAGGSAVLGPVMCGMEPEGNLICSEQAVEECSPGLGTSQQLAFPSRCADLCLALNCILQGCQQ